MCILRILFTNVLRQSRKTRRELGKRSDTDNKLYQSVYQLCLCVQWFNTCLSMFISWLQYRVWGINRQHLQMNSWMNIRWGSIPLPWPVSLLVLVLDRVSVSIEYSSKPLAGAYYVGYVSVSRETCAVSCKCKPSALTPGSDTFGHTACGLPRPSENGKTLQARQVFRLQFP